MVNRIDQLVQEAHRIARGHQRVLIGIVGEPGSGKSTVADTVVGRLRGDAVVVPMDGFHLSNRELQRIGRADRKGAIDTFDAGGYLCLLQRLRNQQEPVVYAPEYWRDIEEPIAGSIAIHSSTPLVVTEGNYLLNDDGAWARVRGLLDQVWYIDSDRDGRIDRLVKRHMLFGKDEASAREWALGSDETNAEVVRATRDRADLFVDGATLDSRVAIPPAYPVVG